MTFAGTTNAAFRRHKPKIMRGPITFKSAEIKSKDAGNTLMMTRLATLFNPKTGKSTKVSIMFDQGSTESYISNKLSRELNLENGKIAEYNITRLGDLSSDSLKIKGPVNRLGIALNDGTTTFIEGIVLSEFLPSLPCLDVPSRPQFSWSNHYKKMPPRSFVKGDVLIGIQHLYMFNLRFERIMGNGYQLWQTAVGPIMCGVPNRDCSPNGTGCLALCNQIYPSGIPELQEEYGLETDLSNVRGKPFYPDRE